MLAPDGQDAVDLVSRTEGRLDLVILDMAMPQLGGEETFHALRRLRPRIPVLVTSGYHESDALTRLTEADGVGFLPKPFQPGALMEAVNALISRMPGPVTG